MYKMNLWEVAILIFFVDRIHWSVATVCAVNQITVVQNHSELCLDCVQCPWGKGSIPHCGSFLERNVTVICKACEEGVSYSESYDYTSCKPCRSCVENQEVIKQCTPTSDTQCGDCKPGFYKSFAHSCEKCSACCQDTQEHDVESECLRQGFPRDKACRYTGRDCGALKPTLLNMEFKTTVTQEEKQKLPLPYLVGAVIFMVAVLILALLTTFVMCRIYCKVKRSRSRLQLQLEEQYNNNNLDVTSQTELGKSLVGNSIV